MTVGQGGFSCLSSAVQWATPSPIGHLWVRPSEDLKTLLSFFHPRSSIIDIAKSLKTICCNFI